MSLQSHLVLRLKKINSLNVSPYIMWSSSWPLDLFQYVHVYHVLKSPEVDALLQTWLHKDWIGRKNHFPGPGGYTCASISSISSVHHWSSFTQKHAADLHSACPLGSQAFCKASFYPADTQPVWFHGVNPLQMQDLTLPYFTELHGVPVNPVLHYGKAPKCNSPALIHPSLVLSAREHTLDISSNWLPVEVFLLLTTALWVWQSR